MVSGLSFGCRRVLGPLALVGALLGTSHGLAADPSTDAASVEEFEKSVRPLLIERCQKCHGPEKQKGGLRLDSREAILRGGESGPAAVPGKPADSLLIDAVNYGDTVQMPPKSRLAQTEVAALTRWVAQGVAWSASTVEGPSATSASSTKPFDIKARAAAHWAWQPVEPRIPPPVKDASRPLGSIDRFILARLESNGLRPAPDADRRVLIRRLAFDLTGLPPAVSEVDAFLNDSRPSAYERLVDRLLATPHFGERWGRHWLDLVRYAESRGHEFDPSIPNAWRYRDYVVRAFNADVPYDKLLTEHIAGDLIERPRVDTSTGANESIIGTGFWFLGEEIHSPVDVRQDETDRMDNRLDVMTKAFLGLTVACARCHDHKFDAISQRDYYALSGFLISSAYRQARFATTDRDREAAQGLQSVRDQARPRLLALAAKAMRPTIDRLADTLLEARSLVPLPDRATRATRLRDVSASSPSSKLGIDTILTWANEISLASTDRSHPFNAFAVTSCKLKSFEGKSFEERLSANRAANTASSGWGLGREDNPSAERKGRVVVDFGTLPSLTRYQDGFAFGLLPARPGDLLLNAGGGRGALGLHTRASASRDAVSVHFAPTEGEERDHGRLGTWQRSGQTLRTPEFTLRSGRLWYLADGAGQAYAAANSHLLIAGPLHNALLTEWTEGGKRWRWVRHDLEAYKGHRLHVEFSPPRPGRLAIAGVVDSEQEPPSLDVTTDFPAVWLSRNSKDIDSPAALARSYQRMFADVVNRMEADRIVGTADAQDVARAADWLLSHLDLFAAPGAPERTAFEVEVAKVFAAASERARWAPAAAPTTPAMFDGNGVNQHLLIRGSSKSPGPEVPRRFLEALAGDGPIDNQSDGGGSSRLQLARQMVAESNPFTARVFVNRVWHHLFGRGLVASVDNFGVMGEPPTHPDLLDSLADGFVKDGWSIKRLIRSVVLSRTYRMSSRPDAEADAQDAGNRHWHRTEVRRLEAEPLRDAILAVSGRLDERIGGPSVLVHLTEYMQGRGRPRSGPLDGDGRRSLYLSVRRNFLAPMMLAFDAPIPFTSMGRRNVSNVPAQALILMNDPFVTSQARQWAIRALRDGSDPAGRVAGMYRAAFSRPPDSSEVAAALGFLESQAVQLGLPAGGWRDDSRVWADLAHVLINDKEFLFID